MSPEDEKKDQESSICRLCKTSAQLTDSHIIPKMFVKALKLLSTSKNPRIRSVVSPNMPLQDIKKVPFLCSRCEELFSKYETSFSQKYMGTLKGNLCSVLYPDNGELRYFILSIAWRWLQYEKEFLIEGNNKLTEDGLAKRDEVIENWRLWLHGTDMVKIRNVQMHIIPTKGLRCLPNVMKDVIASYFMVSDDKDPSSYSCVFIQTSAYIFLTTVFGHLDEIKKLQVGNRITICDYAEVV